MKNLHSGHIVLILDSSWPDIFGKVGTLIESIEIEKQTFPGNYFLGDAWSVLLETNEVVKWIDDRFLIPLFPEEQ